MNMGIRAKARYGGPLYLPIPALFSLVSTLFNDFEQHNKQWMEVWANQLSYNYFEKTGRSDITSSWPDYYNPRTQNPDWFLYPTLGYYAILGIVALAIIL